MARGWGGLGSSLDWSRGCNMSRIRTRTWSLLWWWPLTMDRSWSWASGWGGGWMGSRRRSCNRDRGGLGSAREWSRIGRDTRRGWPRDTAHITVSCCVLG